MGERTCSIDGCETTASARGWCMKHYKRWHKHGDPLHVTLWTPPPQNRPRHFGCSVDGCEAKHSANGMCRNHAERERRREKRDEIHAYQAAYREAHREAARQRSADWRAANPDRFREGNRRYAQENPDKVRERHRRYRAANGDRVRAMNQKRRATAKNAPINDLTGTEWTAIKAAYGQRCAYCQAKSKRLTMDHVQPLSKGGGHTAANIVPACQSCNSRKHVGPAPIYQPLLM